MKYLLITIFSLMVNLVALSQEVATEYDYEQLSNMLIQHTLNQKARECLDVYQLDSAAVYLKSAMDIGVIPGFEKWYYNSSNLATEYFMSMGMLDEAKILANQTLELIKENNHEQYHHQYVTALTHAAHYVKDINHKSDLLMSAYDFIFNPVTHEDSIYYVRDMMNLGAEFVSSATPGYGIACAEISERFCKHYNKEGLPYLKFPLYSLQAIGYFALEKYDESRRYINMSEKALLTNNKRQDNLVKATIADAKLALDLLTDDRWGTAKRDVETAFDGFQQDDSSSVSWRNVKERDRFIHNRKRQYEVMHAACVKYNFPELAYDIAIAVKSMLIRLGNRSNYNKLSWHDVSNTLKSDEVAIEFISYQDFPFQANRPAAIAALVLSKNQSPRIYELNSSDSIDVFQNFWQTISSHLKGIKTVYYSPAGQVATLSLNSILVGKSQYLCDVYDLKMVTSTADIVNAVSDDDFKSAVLIGDIDYGSQTQSDSLRSGVNPLDYSSVEINHVSELLAKKKISQDIFTGAKATKNVFMQLDANAPDLIHISTHGFVDSNLKGASTPVNVMATLLSLDGSGSDEAMRRCGLLMAGANKAWITGECEPGQDDGILTAEEIATLDLSGCRMVVLSACETGLGDATDYEGVVGLQRAFKLAGVRTIVMSLWQVKDDVTALLMTRFYRHLLNDNLTPHEAMRRAQSDIRKDFPDPRDWAAFVVLDG